MDEKCSRKQDAVAMESFNLSQWLTNEVKLPQYTKVFLEHGFELPVECCGIDEAALNTLGIEKIGHRKRILVSSHRLAERFGLSNDVATLVKSADNDGVQGKQNTTDIVEPSAAEDAPPVLPPKKGKKTKPQPPPRKSSRDDSTNIEQEVSSSSIQGEIVNISRESCINSEVDSVASSVTDPNSLRHDKNLSTDSTKNAEMAVQAQDECSTAGLPPGSATLEYEALWKASEGEPLPLSPNHTTQVLSPNHTTQVVSNDDLFLSSGDHNCNNVAETGDPLHISTSDTDESKETRSNTPSGPPPIPPRTDLDGSTPDLHNILISPGADSVTGNFTEDSRVACQNIPVVLLDPIEQKAEEKPVMREKKPAPQKPPRRNKPFSQTVSPSQPIVDKEPKLSLGQFEGKREDDSIYENEVFFLQNKVSVLEEKKLVIDSSKQTDSTNVDDGNLYGNISEMPKAPLQKMISASGVDSTSTTAPKKPVPVPRTKSLSEKPKPESQDGITPDLPQKSSVKNSGSHDRLLVVREQTREGGGSCTDDDLSGSDVEMSEEKTPISSQYETVSIPSLPRTTSGITNRHSEKEGYLFKQGGQQNNKGWKKRWVVFDGKELRYYKDKEHTNESLQRVPVAIMREVRIVTEDTKRARFDLTCAGRTYMFALGSDEMNAIQVWAQILMGAIILCRKENENDIASVPGGEMFDPDKKGFLKKQGNNVVADWKKRYVAVKDGKLAYYHNYEDFIFASPINTLHMNLAAVKLDPRTQNRFQLVTPHRTFLFQCEDERELRSWIGALETAIQLALSDRTVIDKIWENPSNRYCADCGKKDPLWASVNLVVCVCAHCIGVHRNLGVHTSKPRSLLMDEKIWRPSLIKLMVNVGNEASNKFWKFRFPEDDQISPDCSSEEREDFIRKKYQEKRYRHVSSLFGDVVALGEALRSAVVTSDVEQTMLLVFCGADVKYVSPDSDDRRTPYELAKDANQEVQMEFLLQNGGATAEPDATESPGLSTVVGVYEELGATSPIYEVPTCTTVTYEKEGFLYKKAPGAAVWRKRYFTLKGRELWYEKDKEDRGVIRLKDVDEYIYNDSINLDIVTPERTYNLRADTREEALDWYTALRNKQVFQVPLHLQELGSDGVPHLVAKCLQFVETHGLDNEGIYRKNGNKSKIKRLKKLFDQDADSVIISREEYEAHDVAGLVKEYFRELPDPLMTEDAYAHFITASLSPDHNTKLTMYKDSLDRLPEVNRKTLKTVIAHLTRVTAHSSQNLMKLENVSLLFGPTLMSNKQMGAMDTSTINQEFAVMGDFITYYQWLFNVGDDEVLKDQKIEEAMKKMMELASKNSQLEFNELTLDVYSLTKMQESSRITVYSDTKASQICQELVCKRGLAPDGNWALFQVVNEDLERPFQATESVLAVVLETGKFSQLSKDSCLIVKENYLSQKLQAYGFHDDISLIAAATQQTMKEGKKKDNWKKLFIKLEKGVLSVHKSAKSRDDLDSWPVNETTLYLGVDRDKKPVTRFGFTIVRSTKEGNCVYRYICLDDEREQFRWIAVFLKLKYPGKDLWVDPDLEPLGYYAEAGIAAQTNPRPRQKSASKLPAGVSPNILNELRQKQRSIRK